MKMLLVWGLLLAATPHPSTSKVNRLKKEAEVAFQEGRYAEAAAVYSILIDSLGLQDPALEANRAHAYFSAEQPSEALEGYEALLHQSKDPVLRSMALNQIGLLSEGKTDGNVLLDLFKEALKEDPNNEKARYNYQRTAQRLKEAEQNPDSKDNPDPKEENKEEKQQGEQNQQSKQKEQGQQSKQEEQKQQSKQEGSSEEGKKQRGPQNETENQQEESTEEQPQPQPAQENKHEEQAPKPAAPKDEPIPNPEQSPQRQAAQPNEHPAGDESQAMPSTTEKLRSMHLSPERARQILEALRQHEIQYLQQLRRKATQPKDDTKPDW